MRKKGFVTLLVVSLMMFMAACGSTDSGSKKSESEGDAFPSKPIDFIIPFSPGGGTDIMSRTIGKMMNDEGIVEQPFVMTNKVGGSGAEAMKYLYDNKGDPYKLMNLPGNATVLLDGTLDYTFDDFTPLALLAKDANLILVSNDSEFKTIDDLLNKVKENPNTITAAGTAATGAERFVWSSIAKIINSKFKYVPFSSGSEVTTALLGNNVDAAIANPAEALELIESKKVRALAITSEERIEDLPDVPTLKESGIDFVNFMPRGIWAPADLPQEALDYWNQAFEELANSDTWKEDYIEKNNLIADYMDSEEYTNFLKDSAEDWMQFLEEVGIEGN